MGEEYRGELGTRWVDEKVCEECEQDISRNGWVANVDRRKAVGWAGEKYVWRGIGE